MDTKASTSLQPSMDWEHIAYLCLLSRAIDTVEETILAPNKEIYNQFSAKGHELIQAILSSLLTNPKDAAIGYYRSRPFLLGMGLSSEDAIAAPLTRDGGISGGRDVGVVFNFKQAYGPTVFPSHGGVGAQFTPMTGWAQALKLSQCSSLCDNLPIAVSLAGDAAVASNGFWSALTIASTLQLPQLFFIENNGYGISVPATLQIPQGNIVENLKSFKNLTLLNADGTSPQEAYLNILAAVTHVRSGKGPALINLNIPRLCGHTFQDDQSYKPQTLLENEQQHDPLAKLRDYLLENSMTVQQWSALVSQVNNEVLESLERAKARPSPSVGSSTDYVWCPVNELAPFPENLPKASSIKIKKLNMLAAIRRTLDSEISRNKSVLVFGQDVGVKGGVHTVTKNLQQKHGEDRVFDTSLSEEGIVGRAVGLAYFGYKPVVEIQFRKYADSAMEQIRDCGMLRWRSNNKFSAPIVIRMPVGYAKRGDPWHAECNEAMWAHSIGWQVAFPSCVDDAVGLLRSAIWGQNPTIFLEHRSLLDAGHASAIYPGDEHHLAFGQAKSVLSGDKITVISWGSMLHRCFEACTGLESQVELIDLRTIIPWDKGAVCASVNKTGRCLIVHEDNLTAGFGAEIAAFVAEHCFAALQAPVKRLAMPDIPCPHNYDLMDHVLPDAADIAAAISSLLDHSLLDNPPLVLKTRESQ